MVLAIFAIGIPVSAAMFIRSSQAHTRLRQLAVDAIREQLGLTAGLGDVHAELFPYFTIVASDVALDDPIYGRVASAREIRIQPSLYALMRGAVDLDRIDLVGAEVHLLIRDGAIRNLPRIEPGEGGGAITLPFHQLRIVDSTLAVDADPIARGEVRVEEILVRGEPGGVVDIEIDDAPGGFVEHNGRRRDIERIDAHVEIASDAVRIPSLVVAIAELRTTVREGFMPLPPPDPLEPIAEGAEGYRGEIEVDYDLEELRTLALPFELPPIWGEVHIAATIAHDSTHGQRASGTVSLAHGRVLEFGIGETAVLAFEATPESVRIPRGEIEVLGHGGFVEIEGSLGLRGAMMVDVRARARDLSLAHLMEQFDVSSNSLVEWIFDGPLVLRGSLRDLSLSGPIDLRTRDFVVANGGYRRQPIDPVIAIPHGHFRGTWSIRRDGVRFENLIGDLPHSRLFGDVLLGFHNELRVSARAEPADLRDVSPLAGFAIAGAGVATCEVDGVFQDPRVTGHVRIAGFEFDDFRLGEVESDAVLDRDGLGVTFPHVVAVKADSRYAADDVYLDFHQHRFRMAGRIRLERMHLADFYHVFGFEEDERFTSYQAIAHGSADVVYTNGYPADSPSGTLEVQMDLGFDEATLSGYRFDGGHMAGRWRWLDWSRGYAGGELTLDEVTLRKGRGTVWLAGTMDLGGALRMSAAGDSIALRDIEGIGDRMPGLDGVASVTAQISGTPEQMRVDADVGVTNVVYSGRALGDGRAYVRMTHQGDPWIADALAWEGAPPASEPCPLARMGLARGDWPADPPLRTRDGPMPRLGAPSAFVICGNALDGHVAVDLAVGRTERFPLRGRIALDSLDLAAFLPDLGTPSVAPHGKVSGEILVDHGGLLELETLRGSVRLSEIELGRGDLSLTNRGEISISLKNGVAAIDRARFVGPDSRIRVRGQYAMPTRSSDGGLALSIDGDLDLGLVTRITPAVTEAQGRVRSHLALSGAITDPEIYGDAELSGGFVRVAALPTPLEDLGARVTFSARSILIEDVHGRLGSGSVRGHGEAVMEDGAIERYAIQLVADELRVTPAEGLEVALSSEVELAWQRGERLPTARGELRVERLEYTRSIDLGTTLGELSRTQRAEVARYDPEADRVAIDLRVVDEQAFVIRNNLVDAQLEIDESQRPFRIVGTDQRFGLLGDLSFLGGRIFFRNATFERLHGTIAFDDETRVEPRFTVHAVTEIVRRGQDLSQPHWRILLDASGSTESFEIVTHSDPDLPQEDVIMLLAVGMTQSEFEAMQTGDVGSTAALEALTAVTGVDREIRRVAPIIDDFRFTTAYSQTTGRTEPQVSVGRRLADRVRIGATSGVGSAAGRDFRAEVDVQFTDTAGVRCSYDTYGQANSGSFGNLGCDLRWRLEFE